MEEKRIIQTLIIEDDPFSVAVIRHFGDEMHDIVLNVHHVVSLEESLCFLSAHPEIELIILDYRVHSKITGLEILQHIRVKGINVPVIIVTGSGDEEVAVMMMKAGASDYLVKGRISAEVLEKSVKDAIDRFERIDSAIGKENDTLIKYLAIKNAFNGVCVMDISGNLTYVNESFMEMLEYSRENELLKRNVKELLFVPEKFDFLVMALKSKKSWFGELIGKKKNNIEIYLQGLFSLIEYKNNSPAQIMGSFLDITKVREDEKKRDELYRGIMEVFALRAEEVGNVETAGHIHRIAEYVRFIAVELSKIDPFKNYIDEKYINDVSYASMLHDVGKWRTPNEVLLKPTQLSDAEWVIIKKHPQLGVEMLMPLLRDKGSNQYLKLVESVVMYHHERWDGAGYPQGLKGEEIPLSARIVALADNYDALVSERSYRKGLSHEEAIGVINKESGKFDPRILQIFLDKNLEFKRIKESTNKIA